MGISSSIRQITGVKVKVTSQLPLTTIIIEIKIHLSVRMITQVVFIFLTQ